LFSYYAYGLGIHSAIEIPEFVADSANPDLTIKINRNALIGDHLPQEVLESPWAMQVDREQGLVYVKDTGLYLINQGEITFIPAPEVIEEQIRFYLVGTVMSILLYQRKFLVLHGSVIDVRGEAVIFLGNSGDGKSTTAAALHAAGYKLVNDDVAPINLAADHRAFLQPGFPQIKMSSATANALGYDFESLPLIHPQSDKRGYRPQQNFGRSPLKIKRIYVLDFGADFASTPIPFSLAAMELSRHSRPTTLYQRGDALHFYQCANLVKEQTIYRLQRPKNLKLLPQIADFINQDLALNKLAKVGQSY
jgi:hypothetical protein